MERIGFVQSADHLSSQSRNEHLWIKNVERIYFFFKGMYGRSSLSLSIPGLQNPSSGQGEEGDKENRVPVRQKKKIGKDQIK